MAATTSAGGIVDRAASIPVVDPVTLVVHAAAVITQTIASISDANKRRQLESVVAYLSDDQKIKLAATISGQNNQTARMAILYSTVKQMQDSDEVRAAKQKQQAWIIVAAITAAAIAVVVWAKT